ncbi:hypothetical protein D9758_005697 [Tetrapyrgos nigripes]|uniref:[histone H3]-trimethyl-L-lysine(9) demethylase n=1 Tax=Tetrapyrgos nigripes TaxID=182062 RepID=A0A8H5GK28_9AGAR|nr:hypothetical protein D9758_005697 [Tetrapyrgos nigripes]
MASSSPTPSLTPSAGSTPERDIPIQPDHFYRSDDSQPTAYPSPNAYGKTWLDPEDDRLASRGIPVFKPTMKEFRNFEAYMNKVECWGMYSGIVKVIPPKEWTDSLPPLKEQLRNVKIKAPIEQLMLGRAGLFRQQNMEKRKVMSVREWAEFCNQDEYRAPSVDELGARAPVKSTRTRRTRKSMVKAETIEPELAEGQVYIKEEPVDDAMSTVHEDAGSPAPSANAEEKPKVKGRRQPQTKEAREAKATERLEKDEAFLESFDPHTSWLPPNTKPEDYTPEFCAQLERNYWRNCGIGKAPWYGADTQGSLYTDDTEEWNVAHLESELSRLLPPGGIPGVNTPYLYWGMWRATFAWHVEDMDLCSINYIHFGAPKFWYAIPQQQANRLEQTMRSYFPKDTSQCSQFLRHKSFLASPTLLAKSSCKPNHLVQHAGEFVITYPRGYHAGFNLGFNCAESVNFALTSWLEIGRVAKACECVGDSVRIDVDKLLQDREAEWLETEGLSLIPTKFPKKTHKASPVKEEVKQEELTLIIPPLTRPAKRKAETSVEVPTKAKKAKTTPSSKTSAPSSASSSSSSSSRSPPKTSKATISGPLPRLTLKLGPRPTEPDSYPCCLCVSMSKENLLPVQDPPMKRREAMEACGYPKVWMAHEDCASIVPETWVDEGENGEKVVFGVDGIVKDRWNLKCTACTKNRAKAHGAPIQCTKGKCSKAFHISCARENKDNILFSILREVEKEVVLLDAGHQNVQLDANDASQDMQVDNVLKIIKKYEVQVLCSQHNPLLAAAKKASKQDKIKNDLLALPPMSRIKVRVSTGVFEVSLVRVIEETSSVEVLWDRGIKREFKWGSVIFGNTDGPVQQKPSTPAPDAPRLPTPSMTVPPAPASKGKTPQYSVALPTPTPNHQPYGAYTASQYPYLSYAYPYGHWNQVSASGYPATSSSSTTTIYYPNAAINATAVAGPGPTTSAHFADAGTGAAAGYEQYTNTTPMPNQAPSGSTLSGQPVNWQHYRPSSDYYAYNQTQTQTEDANAQVLAQPVPAYATAQAPPASSTPVSMMMDVTAPAPVAAPQPSSAASQSPSPSPNPPIALTAETLRDLSSLSSLQPTQIAELLNQHPNLRAAVMSVLATQAQTQVEP